MYSAVLQNFRVWSLGRSVSISNNLFGTHFIIYQLMEAGLCLHLIHSIYVSIIIANIFNISLRCNNYKMCSKFFLTPLRQSNDDNQGQSFDKRTIGLSHSVAVPPLKATQIQKSLRSCYFAFGSQFPSERFLHDL